MEAARLAEVALAEAAPRQKRLPGAPSEPLIADGGTRRRGRPPKVAPSKAEPIPSRGPAGAPQKGRRRSNKPPVIPPAPSPVEGAPPAAPAPPPEPAEVTPWSLGDGNVE
jgi:hypothetical protein